MSLCNRTRPAPLSRREMLRSCALGFGSTALAALLAEEAVSAGVAASSQMPHFRPRARNVIFLFMEGGISQVDSFDPKPALRKHHGKPFPVATEPTQFNAVGNTMKSPWMFRPYGESGIEVSDLFPHIGSSIDDIAVVRSLVSEFPEHTNANYHMHTCSGRQGLPSAGAWINYGLGSENKNLPGFVVIESNSFLPPGGVDNFGAGFLPATYQGSMFRAAELPLANIRPAEKTPQLQRNKLDLVRGLDEAGADQIGRVDQVESAIANFELAFRMQSAVPGLTEFSDEAPSTLRMYGLESGSKQRKLFGTECLLARRMIERGVRFVELLMPDGARWDQHDRLRQDHTANARTVDQPVAALIADLKQRGLLDETLLVFTGEFGRTPFAQGKNGRDHNEYGFSAWLCGGGIRGGMVYGATDELGYKVVENKVTVYDLHATILHLLGLDHTRLTYRFAGRDMRLTDVHGEVVKKIIV